MLSVIPIYYQSFLIVASATAFFVGLLLFAFPARSPSKGKILAFFFFFLSYPIFLTYLVSTGFIYYLPHLYRTGYIATILVFPLSYLYFREVLEGRELKMKDSMHVIPALVYVLDYLPFFLLSASEKMQGLMTNDIALTILNYEESRIFPEGGYLLVKYFLQFSYWALQLRLLSRIYSKKSNKFRNLNHRLLLWLKILIFSQLTLMMPPIPLFFQVTGFFEYFTYMMMIGGLCAISCSALFFLPEILYGFQLLEENHLSHSLKGNGNSKYLPESKTKEIAKSIEEYFEKNQPYLQLRYSLTQLASELNIPSQYISSGIHEFEDQNFNDYVNRHRIQYCLQKLGDEKFSIQKMDWIAQQCGFSNRNTFSLAFKKVTGSSPSEYIKRLRTSEK
jgi:AraC-like DNA-binding protein